MSQFDTEQLNKYMGDYCFGEVCEWMKQSDEYHKCKLMDENKCQLWIFLRWVYSQEKK